MQNNKISIVYRIYPKVSKVPPVHSKDKYKLSRLCLKSMARALEGIDYKLWVLLDNCPQEYEELFRSEFGSKAELINLPAVGNATTFSKQIDILLEQNFSELVYFAEDDYFYLPNAFKNMIELMNSDQNVDFVSAYDHLDYYNLDMHKYKSNINFTSNQHWRTGASTCMTFLTTKKILRATKSVFMTYTKRNYDGSIWFSLTKNKIRNPYYVLKYLLTDRDLFKIFAKAWYFSFFQLFFGKKYKLWIPIPSLATHMDNKFLAPTYKWDQIFNDFEKDF